MTAEIKTIQPSLGRRNMQATKLSLLSKIEGSVEDINHAITIPGEDSVISITDDKTVRVWLLRDSGQYWPSVCSYMPSAPSTLDYCPNNRDLFIGLDNGTISEFELGTDGNRLTHRRDYLAHVGRITALIFTPIWKWVLSVSRDKSFQFHCTETGARIGGSQFNTWCTSLLFDAQSKHAFVGDYSGLITLLQLTSNGSQLITTINGHSGCVRALAWDPERKLLFSGSTDQTIMVWDIGGKRGKAYHLDGQQSKIVSLHYYKSSKRLISSSDEGTIAVWDMESNRKEVPDWLESDICQICQKPFFWNFRAILDQKSIGSRQHHCRNCGKAVCGACSSRNLPLPTLGYEFPTRVCDTCHSNLQGQEQPPLASFHDTKHCLSSLHFEDERCRMISIGQDRVIKLWDVSSVLQ